MEEKQYEAICEICSQPFETNDEEDTICPACWQTIVGEHEGTGTDD